MSLRSGDNTKKAQKYKNAFAFKHNKNSMTTRKILSVPLDFLCERCLEKMEWRLSYRKYKPLTTPSKCNLCQEKNIYKAYRTICESCATKDNKKLCTKCTEPVDQYGRPNCRNDPNAGVKKQDPLFDLVKNLKKKYQKTVYRKINDGIKIAYDETKGIINKETKEIIIPLENFVDFKSDEEDEGDDSNSDNSLDGDELDKKETQEDKKEEIKGEKEKGINESDCIKDKENDIDDEQIHT